MNKHAFTAYLSEIKSFFGPEWFQQECDRAGEIPDARRAHPMIYYWIQTENCINKKNSLPVLNIVPKYEMLSVFELAQYIRIVAKAEVCDLAGNVLDLTVQDLFQHRLRTASPAHYYSALYEMQIASLYLRKGYVVRFIEDAQKHPEFVVKINGENIYVECKRMDKRLIDRADENTLGQIYNKIEKSIIAKNLGVLVVCDNEISNEDDWMLKKIKELIDVGVSTQVEQVDDYSFKIFSASLRVPVSDTDTNVIYNHNLHFLEKQLPECSPDSVKIIPMFAGKVVVEPSGTRYSELQGCFAVALRKTPNLISGIKKLISNASSQLPKQGIGIVYVATPPYDASEEEAKEFWRHLHKESNSAARINAVVTTGVLEEDNSFSHVSVVTVKKSSNCNKPLPHDFQVLPLLDKCALKFDETGTHRNY